MGKDSFLEAIERGGRELALRIFDDVVKEATRKASDESKAAGLSVYDGRLNCSIGPNEPDPYSELLERRDDLRVTKTKMSGDFFAWKARFFDDE